MTLSPFWSKQTTATTAKFAGTETSYAPEEHKKHVAEGVKEVRAAAPAAVVPVSSTQQQKQKTKRAVTNSRRSSQLQRLSQQQQQRDPIHFYASLAAGVGSGALSSVMCAPLDLVRTRLQVWSDLHHKLPTATLKQAFVDIFQKEGWRGYFRGLGASLITVPAFWGVYFPLYDDCKRRWLVHSPNTNPSIVHCGSAVMAGAVSDILCNPMFVVRTRLQTDALHHHHSNTVIAEGGTKLLRRSSSSSPGILRTIRALYQEGGGIAIFWRGMTANLMGLSHVAGE